MKIKRLLLIGLVVGILSSLWGWVTCGWLFNWVYSLEPTVVWRSIDEVPFPLMSLAHLVFAFLLAFVYASVQKSLPGQGVVKGVSFGFFVWLVGALPGNFAMGIFTVIAPEVIVYWMIIFFVASLWQGLLIAAIYGKES